MAPGRIHKTNCPTVAGWCGMRWRLAGLANRGHETFVGPLTTFPIMTLPWISLMDQALEGLRVLDFSHALAGPYCTLLLAEYGAAIYKLESPQGGELARGWGPPFAGDDSFFFLGLNRGK